MGIATTNGRVSKSSKRREMSIPIREVFHELRTFVERGVRDVGIVQPSDEVGDRVEVLLMHPFVYTGEYLRDKLRSMRIERTAHLYGRRTRQEAFDDIFPIMHAGRRRDGDVRELPGDDGRPAKRIAQVAMIAEHVSRHDLEGVDINIRTIETVEEHHAVCSVGI